jgi:HEPN domain-containing protein
LSETDRDGEARRWLRYAQEDLDAVRVMRNSETAARHACWLSQQSAEKAIKAVLVCWGVDFPRSHDLDLLHNLLPVEAELRKTTVDLAELTEWAVEARYPGDWPEATPDDASRAAAAAEEVLRVAITDLHQRGIVAQDA